MERERADVGQEGLLGGGVDSRAEAFDEGGVFLQRGIERLADGEDICCVIVQWLEKQILTERRGVVEGVLGGCIGTVFTTLAIPGSLVEIAELSYKHVR